VACKLYPAGATTNADSGVTAIDKIYPVLEAMQTQGLLLLIHGEVTDSEGRQRPGLVLCSHVPMAANA
jgi:dihydroorotase